MKPRRPKPKRPYWAPLILTILTACAPRTPPASSGSPWDVAPDWMPVGAVSAQGEYTDAQLLAAALERLHRLCQPDGPVGVLVDDHIFPGLMGQTERMGAGYFIRISPEVHGQLMLFVLCHEWAHCLAYPTDAEFADPASCGGHGRAWGLASWRTFIAVWFDQSTPAEQPAQQEECK